MKSGWCHQPFKGNTKCICFTLRCGKILGWHRHLIQMGRYIENFCIYLSYDDLLHDSWLMPPHLVSRTFIIVNFTCLQLLKDHLDKKAKAISEVNYVQLTLLVWNCWSFESHFDYVDTFRRLQTRRRASWCRFDINRILKNSFWVVFLEI